MIGPDDVGSSEDAPGPLERRSSRRSTEWKAARTSRPTTSSELGAIGPLGLEYDEAYGGMGADLAPTP